MAIGGRRTLQRGKMKFPRKTSTPKKRAKLGGCSALGAAAKYKFFNPNPAGRLVGDCSIRAICKAVNVEWPAALMLLVAKSLHMYDLPTSNAVIGAVLRDFGFYRDDVDEERAKTVADIAEENAAEKIVIITSGHIVTADKGTVYDSWDSRQELALYFYRPRRAQSPQITQ